MKNSTSPIKNLRAALVLIVMLMTTLTASATDFITDVKVVGNKNQTDFNSLISSLVSAGWTDINYDLNSGCGSGTDYIHLLFKKQSSSGNTGTPITDFYIKTGNNPPSSLTHEGRTYYLVPYDGSSSFINSQGDLNNNAGGAYIHLYYTKDALTNNHGVTGITFNTTQSDAVGADGGSTGYDLNAGCGSSSAYIYTHLATATGGNVVTLTSGSGNVQLLNGHILTGTGGADTRVKIADGATVTFNGVNLTAITNNSSHSWPGIHCLGNATIVLNGGTTNSVQGGYFSSGIYVAANKTLAIQGNGTLTATGRDYAAGIGSGQSQSSCGNITISSGTVTATGGQNASGIGSGAEQQSCGNITISGGTINATGLTYAAGIGSGYDNSSCGSITISGGTVTATGGLYAAAIGSGYSNASCGNITITNDVTRVTATRHNNSTNSVGAGKNSSCGTVTIGNVQTGYITMSSFVTYPYTVSFNSNDGTGTTANQAFMYNVAQNLTSNTFYNGGHPFLGWATSANGPIVYNDGQSVINLTQTAGATVTLYAKWSKTITLASSTGEVLLQNGDTLTGTGGSDTHVKIADGATVIFIGVNVTTIANYSSHQWPGIHCLGNATIVLNEGTTNSVKGGYQSPGIYVAANNTLTIQGSGTLNVTGQTCGAGIGSSENLSSCGNIIINSGTVNATGGYYSAAIGSGRKSSCGNITISGGTVTAQGEYSAAGIGSGYDHASCGSITINGGTVTANGGSFSAAIGSGYSQSSCGTITITNGVTRVTARLYSINSNISTVGNGLSSTCGTVKIDDVTGFISKSPFVTYPYTVHFDANGGTGTMADQTLMNDVAKNLRAHTFTRVNWVFQGWATSATGPKVYDDEQSVSNMTDTSGATVTLYANWTLGTNHFSMNGDTCTISTEIGWDYFCYLLAENNNGYFTGKTVKLANNINVTTMAGSSGHEFSGTFDGQGHTLNVNYQNNDSTVPTAPFSYVNGATIQNLIVAGSIDGTANRAAGIVGETVRSLSHITNCASSVDIHGGNNTGGISIGGHVEITGCVFNGKITSTSMRTGGFVGSSDSALVISNSLFAPQASSSITGGTFYYDDETCEITLVNSYYTEPLDATPQGKQARSIVGGWYVTVAFNGQATIYNTSGINAYSVGIVYGSTLYAGYGDMVSLNLSCTPPLGFVWNGYTINNGTLTGAINPYTLAMPDEAVTIQAVLKQLPPVAYIDGNGVAQQCTAYTIVTNNLDFSNLPAGWYVVNDSITLYYRRVHFSGDAHLILCDSTMLNITCGFGSALTSDGSLTLYDQSGGTGNLIATCDFGDAIAATTNLTINGGNVIASVIDHGSGIQADRVTLNRGMVTATVCTNGIDADDLTINGSTVTVTGSSYGIIAERVTINSGIVNATGNTSGICHDNIAGTGYVTINGGTLTTNEIYFPKVTLGWSAITDSVTVGNFTYSKTPTVTVKSGQAFYYIGEDSGDKQVMDTVVVSGALNEAQIAAIGGKTLAPYTLPPVAYIDENGVTQQCTFYTVVTNELDFDNLSAGWYVVSNNITRNGEVNFFGDTHLILCDGATMNINSLYANTSLTLYGQSGGTGNLTATSNTHEGIRASILTINGCTVNASSADATGPSPTGISAITLTINGSTVTAIGCQSGISAANQTVNGSIVTATGTVVDGISADNLTINGSTVNATGNSSGISIGNASGYVTINGGTVTTNKIFSPTVNLGWSNLTDRLTVGSFTYSSTPTISVKSGQAFYYISEDNGEKQVMDTVVISGTLTTEEIAAIGGKTLAPYTLPSVAYIDENGVEQQCTFYTVVNNNLDFSNLPAGWYVVNSDITLGKNRYVHFSGDAHLILCDNTAMNISVGDNGNKAREVGEALKADISLTLYGQSGGTGSLNATSHTAHGIDAPNLTINGGTVNTTSNYVAGYGIAATNLTINGGTVMATGYFFGIDAHNQTINGGTITATGIVHYGIVGFSVTINSGTINAIGSNSGIYNNNGYVTINGGTVTTNKIDSPTIALGWSNTNDRITVGNFAYGDSTPTVSVKSGQTLYYKDGNETVIVSGTLGSDQISAIGRKTLRPYIPPVTQTVDLAEGWNWFSPYVKADNPIELLQMLEESLGENAEMILSMDNGMTAFDGEEWFGDLDDVGLANTQMYMILTNAACTLEMVGEPANVSDYEISIKPGWNWIGFPSAEAFDVVDALADFAAEEGDILLSQDNGLTSYDGEEWFGDLETLEPGVGLMYYSSSSETKTLVYSTAAKARMKSKE